jgi:hypothetical protein
MKPFSFVMGLLVALAMIVHPEKLNSAELAQVLGERALWGKDFPEALTFIQAWNRVGERTVAVFPNKIAGTSPLPSASDAQPVARELSQALTEIRPQPTPQFRPLMVPSLPARLSFQPEVVRIPGTNSFQVAWTGPSVQFLASNLTIADVRQRLGDPETVVQEVEQTEGERRPAVLRIYVYANGAVQFVESDLSPRPGSVDHARLDVPMLSSTLFQ